MNVSIKQLKAFMALCEQRNFTRAASAVFLSQPAFSALINALETELGFRLFDRDTRSVHLTPDGEAFHAIAQRHIRLYEDSEKEIKAIGRGETGRVYVAALPSVAVSWLPAILPDFCRAYPQVRIELYDAPSDRCLQMLNDNIADFALTAFRVNDDELCSEKLCSERYHLVCRKDHPLAQHESIRLTDLDGHMVINFSQRTSIRQVLDHALPPDGRYHTFEVEQLTTMMGLIAAGLGVSLVPSLTLYQFLHPDLVTRPLAEELFREVHLIRRVDRSLSSAAENFCSALVSHARAIFGPSGA